MTHNGWTNWESWNLGVHLDNDEDLYNMAVHMVNVAGDVGIFEDWVTELVESQVQDGTIAMDYVRASLHEVDWKELYNHFKNEDEDG